MKKNLFSLLVAAATCMSTSSIAQVSVAGTFSECGINTSGGTHSFTSYNSGHHTAGKTTSATFHGPAWTGPEAAALAAALNYWSQTITSPVDIYVGVTWAALPIDVVARTRAVTYHANFSSSDPAYIPNTFYPAALANKLAGTDLNGSSKEIEIELNSYFSFYLGTDGNNITGIQPDLVTVLMHEIGHGLGLDCSIRKPGTQAEYQITSGSSTFPTIYDRKLIGNTNGQTPNVMMTSLTSGTQALTDYAQSSNVFWNGTFGTWANGGTHPPVSAPVYFDKDNTLKHLSGYIGSELMAHPMAHKSIHTMGPIGIGMLDDIGWGIQYSVGIEDNVEIERNGTPITPETILNENGSYSYYAHFFDEYPYGDWVASTNNNWTLELLHEGGKYVLQTGNGVIWNLTVNTLPSGYKWMRDANGRVRAHLSVTSVDNDNTTHKDMIEVFINYRPNVPDLTVPGGSWRWVNNCETATISYYAAGATSYYIYMWEGGSQLAAQYNAGSSLNYTFNWLDEYKNYYFFVEAYNAFGAATSTTKVRPFCKLKVELAPVPVVNGSAIPFNISIDNEGLTSDETELIGAVSIVSSETGEIIYSQNYADSDAATGVSVDGVSDYPPGNYSVIVTSTSGGTGTANFVVTE